LRILGLVLAAMMMLVAVGAFFAWRVRRPARARPVATADMPLAIGDTGTYFPRPNHSCSSYVAALEPGGRLLVAGCGSGELVSVAPQLFELSTYEWAVPTAGDVALFPTGKGWERTEVLGSEPGERIGGRQMATGATVAVDRAAAMVVQKRSEAGYSRFVPLPSDAELRVGDVVTISEGPSMPTVRIDALGGSSVTLRKGWVRQDGVFEPGADPAVERERSKLRARVLAMIEPIAHKTHAWIVGAKASRRVEVLRDLDHYELEVRDAGGGAATRVSRTGVLVGASMPRL
jgi:hypothetical protein